MKVKNLGQVFTPKSIVEDILNVSNYYGEHILNKHVIDNSCGDGAFLVEIVKRYIHAYKEFHGTYKGIETDLKKYIHGIEIDKEIYMNCIANLNKLLSEYDLAKLKFNILNRNALAVTKFDNKMDFVLGNPPYVRIHNLEEQYVFVKKYSFCEGGMTDLYIVFYEIGLKMLKKNGVLCYITPNSFYNSLAGSKLRKYLKESHTLELLMDLGHFQPFNVTTYTTICKIHKKAHFDFCKYFKYNLFLKKPEFICDISYNNLFSDNNIILSNSSEKFTKVLNYDIKQNLLVKVKNGFATLNDVIFIQNNFDFNDNMIDVIKASTGGWKKCIYPYDKNGKLIPFNGLDINIQRYFLENKSKLFEKEKKSNWYAFGRTQAINDVMKSKISINTTVKDISSIKLNIVKPGDGVYSGLYLLTDIKFDIIKKIICSENFIDYLKVLNKCKSGGYYTFSSRDLAKFINCSLEDKINE